MAGRVEPVAVLGIGAMGHGMAASALRAGIPTIVWDRRMEAARDLAERGAEVAETAADAARRGGGGGTKGSRAEAVIAGGPGQGQPRGSAPGRSWGQARPTGGGGRRLKLVNNTWLALAHEAVAASVALARQLGLDTATVADALAGSPLVSAWQEAKLQRIAGGEFSAQFALSLAVKDVHLALEAAGADRFAVLACLADEWQQAVDQGLGDQDLTIVTRALEQQAGSPHPS